MRKLLASAVAVASLLSAPVSYASSCLFISSYHTGYQWSDGVERGVHNALDGKCDVTTFNMDTKRNKSEKFKLEAAKKAKQLITDLKPDVVIAADDNAAKYLIVPYYKNSDIPFVFCGINWTVEKYGFPFSNVTGMIEVAAIQPLFDKATSITGKIKTAYYIGANTLTEEKNLERFLTNGKKNNIKITRKLSKTVGDWLKAYKEAQSADLIIMGSNAGIPDWDENDILNKIRPITKTLSVTNHKWMMPYTMFGMTKIPEEHGEWAGQIALEIIRGSKPLDIPIIPNRKFDIIINKYLLSTASIKVPEFIKLKAQTFDN